MLNCQNFADMPGLYAALKERLPTSVQWSEPKPVRWLVKPYQGIILVIVSGWLFIWVLNIDFIHAFNLSLILFWGIQLTSQIFQQSQHASRGAKVALILGATWILVAWLYAMGDIPQAINHPCGLVHRWQSGCLKAYPDSENLLFLPEGHLARLSGRAIVIEPVSGNRFFNLFQAARLRHDWYVSSFSLSADGRTAVAEHGGAYLSFWNVPEQSTTLQHVDDRSNTIVISPDGRLIGPSGRTKNLAVWDAVTWQPVFSLHTEDYVDTAFRETLVAVGLDQTVGFYDVKSGEETAVFSIDWSEEQDSVRLMAFSDDEQLLAFVTNQNILSILQRDGNEWQEIHRVQLDPAWQSDDALAFSTDNTLLAVAQDFYSTSENRGQLLIFSLADMELLQTVDLGRGLGQLGSVRVLDFSPDNTLLAVSSSSEGAVFELEFEK